MRYKRVAYSESVNDLLQVYLSFRDNPYVTDVTIVLNEPLPFPDIRICRFVHHIYRVQFRLRILPVETEPFQLQPRQQLQARRHTSLHASSRTPDHRRRELRHELCGPNKWHGT